MRHCKVVLLKANFLPLWLLSEAGIVLIKRTVLAVDGRDLMSDSAKRCNSCSVIRFFCNFKIALMNFSCCSYNHKGVYTGVAWF